MEASSEGRFDDALRYAILATSSIALLWDKAVKDTRLEHAAATKDVTSTPEKSTEVLNNR
jgi:hypothetical protein